MYLTEISSMMHTFGDVKQPDEESVKLMQAILRDQMNILLLEAENTAVIRRGSKINHGDVLFLMRKNKMKLKRLIEYLSVSDWKQGLNYFLSLDEVFIGDLKSKGKLVKKCFDFMESIEDWGEFASFMQDETVIDITVKRRKLRRYWMTCTMSAKEYNEFAEMSRATFYPFQKFKRWLLQDKVVSVDLTDEAVRIINFLARETIAEIVDLVLILKMRQLGIYQHFWYDCTANSLQIDLNLKTWNALGQTNGYDDYEGDYSTNTVANDICSVYDQDPRDEMIVSNGKDFNYFSPKECTKKNTSSFEMKKDSTVLNTEQNNLLSHISSERSQSDEDSLQEKESVCQQRSKRFDSESSDGLPFNTSECYEEASNETELNSVRTDFRKSSGAIFSNDSQRETCDITEISDEDVMYDSKSRTTDISNYSAPRYELELSNMSDTDVLYSENDSLPNVPSNSSKPSSCSGNKFQETPISGTSSQIQEEEPIVDISDTSDHESFPNEIMAPCDHKKSSKRKIGPNNPSRRTAREEPVKEKTAIVDYVSIAAKNEVKFITPIEPEEIAEAYALFQKPSPMVLILKSHISRITKLICLADSISLT